MTSEGFDEEVVVLLSSELFGPVLLAMSEAFEMLLVPGAHAELMA